MLQNSYCVAALQPRRPYNGSVTPTADRLNHGRTPSRWGAARRVRLGARAAGVVIAILGTGVLAAACSGAPASPGIASLGKTTTTAGPAAAHPVSPAAAAGAALAYVNCLRTHGEPTVPDPTVSAHGIAIKLPPGIGTTQQFIAANNACKHLLPNNGVPAGSTITAADQADYLEAAACMRSHGVANFPDPVFEDNSVSFSTRSPIDTGGAQYKSALAVCEKLIPPGLPYSSPGTS